MPASVMSPAAGIPAAMASTEGVDVGMAVAEVHGVAVMAAARMAVVTPFYEGKRSHRGLPDLSRLAWNGRARIGSVSP